MLTDIRTEINELTRLEYYLNSDEFKIAIGNIATGSTIELLIKSRDLNAIKDYIRQYQSLEEFSVKQLRKMGATLRVANYHLLTKDELIERIHSVRNQRVT